jgi:hypothetical protein
MCHTDLSFLCIYSLVYTNFFWLIFAGSHITDEEIKLSEDKFAESLHLAQMGMFNLLENDVSCKTTLFLYSITLSYYSTFPIHRINCALSNNRIQEVMVLCPATHLTSIW